MKEHAKKALKHDTKVLGKTVPTMLIIGLFLVGGTSAAILSSFGTVSGEAEVEQAVVVGESSGNNQLGFFGASHGESADVTAGTVTVDTFTVENNMNTSYSPTFTSYDAADTSGDSVSSSTQFEWAGSESDGYGIRTSFVNYYPEAGADTSVEGYEAGVSASDDTVLVVDEDSTDSDTENQTISNALTYAEEGDTILVEAGTYEDRFVVNEEVDIVASNSPFSDDSATVVVDGDNNQNRVNSDGVTIKGLHFRLDDQVDSSALYVNTGDGDKTVAFKENYFEDTTSQPNSNTHAMKVSDSSDTIVRDNQFEGFYHGVQITNTALQKVDIVNNTFNGQYLDGVFVTADGSHSADVNLNSNLFKNIDLYAVLLTQPEGDTTAQHAEVNVEAEANRFSGNGVDISARNVPPGNKGGDFSTLGSVEGTFDFGEGDSKGNFFAQGTWSEVSNGNLEGDVTASYEQVDSVSADSTETVAAVNEFALMLDGSQDYSLTTTIS